VLYPGVYTCRLEEGASVGSGSTPLVFLRCSFTILCSKGVLISWRDYADSIGISIVGNIFNKKERPKALLNQF
jgi:hypothetical protein